MAGISKSSFPDALEPDYSPSFQMKTKKRKATKIIEFWMRKT